MSQTSSTWPRKMPSRLGPPPPPTSEAVSRSMKGNIGRGTKPELILRRLLREAGYPGYRLNWKKAPGRPDIAYPGRKVAVFVHGDWWHRCPRCNPPLPRSNRDFWARKFALNIERDQRKVDALEQWGWTVVVVWECELKGDQDAVILRLREALGTP